jgi:hypothetical protein
MHVLVRTFVMALPSVLQLICPDHKRLHWSFEDPSRATGSEAERLQVFRRTRDDIAARVRAWLTERAR